MVTTTSEQCLESTEGYIEDQADLKTIKEKFSTCRPFSSDLSLENIITTNMISIFFVNNLYFYVYS